MGVVIAGAATRSRHSVWTNDRCDPVAFADTPFLLTLARIAATLIGVHSGRISLPW
jgi:hypothetical protein